jgi:hypothetical protein
MRERCSPGADHFFAFVVRFFGAWVWVARFGALPNMSAKALTIGSPSGSSVPSATTTGRPPTVPAKVVVAFAIRRPRRRGT